MFLFAFNKYTPCYTSTQKSTIDMPMFSSQNCLYIYIFFYFSLINIYIYIYIYTSF